MRNYDRVLEENNEMYYELEELRSEVKHLEDELNDAQEVLDNIEDILIDELGEKLGTKIYMRIFGLN